MFREEYIKANEQIQPDNEFLERLKTAVAEEDRVVHIGDYVDYENSEDFEVVGKHSNRVTYSAKQRRITWKKVVAIAACFILLCTMAFVVGNVNLLENGQGLQVGMESVIEDMDKGKSEKGAAETKPDDVQVDVECQKQYEIVYNLFVNNNVVIYEVDEFGQNDNEIAYLQELQKGDFALRPEQRDELVGNITAKKYILCDNCEDFSDTKCYVAQFEDDTCVYFIIDADEYIYIDAVSGIKSLADKDV